jgi:hypothetical protein
MGTHSKNSVKEVEKKVHTDAKNFDIVIRDIDNELHNDQGPLGIYGLFKNSSLQRLRKELVSLEKVYEQYKQDVKDMEGLLNQKEKIITGHDARVEEKVQNYIELLEDTHHDIPTDNKRSSWPFAGSRKSGSVQGRTTHSEDMIPRHKLIKILRNCIKMQGDAAAGTIEHTHTHLHNTDGSFNVNFGDSKISEYAMTKIVSHPELLQHAISMKTPT